MKKIIAFKSDRLGDLMLFSPCLKIIKDNIKDAHITLVCSEFNYQIAKNYEYVDKFIILKKNIIGPLLKNFKYFFLTKYKYLFQFDGKNSSYLISYFIKSKIKSTICFVKYKKIFKINYKIRRPPLLLLKLFFNTFIFCDERYSISKDSANPVHYQTNYFNILEKLNFKITDKKNIFSLDKGFENIFKNFYSNFIKDKFYIFHFDEKWERLKDRDYANSLKIIQKISFRNKVIITTGVKNFTILNDLEKKFTVYKFDKNLISLEKDNNTNKILLLKKIPLNLLSYFIKNSEKNISFHSGPIVHISSAFDKDTIDIIPKSKNEELDRWIPLVSKYQRINFEELNDVFIENFKF